MKEFSSLNGYLVKDKTARTNVESLQTTVNFLYDSLLNYETPQMWHAYGDGIHDDTEVIQNMLDTGNDIYLTEGTYLITGSGLTMTKENQKIVSHGKAWIVAKNITSGYVLLINSKFNKLYDVKIRLEDTTENVNAIQLGAVTEELVATSTAKISNDGANLRIIPNTVYNLTSTSSDYNTYVNADREILYKDWLKQNKDYSITIIPEDGGNYTIGFTNDNKITTNEKKSYTYNDLVTNETAGKLSLQVEVGKSYLFVIKKGIVVTENNNFTTCLYNATTTGTGRCGLQINGAEARVYDSKFRGTKYGINIEAPDFYGENIYCEQCTSDGFRARAGSIEGHHIHSYNNANKGFNLSGINYSNFYGIYADKNVGDGIYIADNTGEVNIFGGWGFYSGYQRTDKTVFDWNFSNVKDLNLWGCRSNGGDETKVASYNIQENCRIYLYNCMANIAPQIKDGAIAKFLNCQDRLKKYNTAPNAYNGTRQVVDASAVSKVTVYLDEILNEEKDIMAFDVVTQFRSVLGYTSGMTKHLLQLSEAYEDKFVPIAESEKITVSSPSVTFVENGATVVEFNVMNNTEEQLQVNVTLTKVGSVY